MGRRKQTLGPANDDSEAVRVEMRAAEMYSRGYDDAPPFDDATFLMGLLGFANHEKQHDKVAEWPPDGRDGVNWWAGWLLRELATHDDRDQRDADAWPWDPSRPVAGQYEIVEQHAQDEALRLEAWKANEPVRAAARRIIASWPEDNTPTPPLAEDEAAPRSWPPNTGCDPEGL